MCSRPSVEVPSRGSHLPRTSSRIPAALLLYASPLFDNKRVICRARDAIARLNAACALLRSHRLYLLIRLRSPLPLPHPLFLSLFFHFKGCACLNDLFVPRCARGIFLLRALSVVSFFSL